MKKKLSSLSVLAACFTIAMFDPSIASYGQAILYGMTQNGGAHGKGVPYQINADGTGFFSYLDFDGTNGEHPGNGARFTQAIDKRFEGTGLTVSGLVGLTEGGGQYAYGHKVRIKPGKSGMLPLIFGLNTEYSGTHPTGGLLASQEGIMYGLTSQNGQYGDGALFSTGDYFGNDATALGSFNGINGRSPKGSVIRGINGKLYGTTEFGGVNDLGVIFSYDNTGQEYSLNKIFDFDGAVKGSNPTGNLVLASDGRLYGMTKNGGVHGGGVVFSIQHDGSGYVKLLDLNDQATGGHPYGSLTLFTDGKLYGMTSSGGSYGYGTIFSITLTGAFTKIYDFDGPNGKSPVGDLLVDISGTVMYGTAYAGGVNDKGVLFKLQNGVQFTKLFDYSATTGSNPVGALVMMKSETDIRLQPILEKTTLSTPFTPTVETTVDMPVYFTSKNTSVIAVENNMLVVKGPGTSEITAFQLGNHAYLAGLSKTLVTVKKAPQQISSFPSIDPKIFGDAPFELSATATSGLPVSFTSSNSAIAAVDDKGKVTIYGAGYMEIIASQPGDLIYESAESVVQLLYVERAAQTINFPAIQPHVCCGFFNISATSSANLKVKFKTNDRLKLNVFDYEVQPIDLGTAEIIAYQPGDNNYKPAEARATVEIVKGFQSIVFNVNGTYKLGDPPAYLATGSDRGLPITYTSDPPGIAVVENGSLHFLATGTTVITATQSGNRVYHAAMPISRTVTVNPPVNPGTGNTITWPEINNKTVVDPPFNLTASATSGLPVSYSSSNPSVAEINGNLVTIRGVGSTTITARQPGKSGVAAALPVAKELQVTKRNQYLYFSLTSSINYGEEPIPLAATTLEGLPITYTLSDNSLGYIENYYLNITGIGYLTVTASQIGNDKYLPALPVAAAIRIDPIYDEIFFKTLSTSTFGDPPVSLYARAKSESPVAFSSSDPDIATVSGHKLIVKRAGTVRITAATGARGYYPAEVQKMLVIRRAKQQISLSALEDKKFGAPPFVISTSSNSKLPVTLSTTTPEVIRIIDNVVTIIGNGTAEIIASQAGDYNYEPAAEVHEKFVVTDAGNLYDMIVSTLNGGPHDSGVLFSMNSEGQGYETIKQFDPISSPFPQGGFIKGADGKMYGNFTRGGTGNAGRIIRLEADGTGLTILHDFKGSDGEYPIGNLIQATNGDLYGTTEQGGSLSGGTIFSIKPDGTEFTVLQHLGSLSGQLPKAGLTQATDGKLYGITEAGGTFGFGTIFTINADGSGFSVIFHLREDGYARTGHSPTGELSQGPDGFLYGTTTQGGSDSNNGTLFKIKTDGSEFLKIIEFNRTVNGSAATGLLFASNGKIYGMTGGGGANGAGAIFSLESDGTDFTQIFSFDGLNSGSFPRGKLIEASDGALYGMTYIGGINSRGTVFRINKNATGYHKMTDLGDVASHPIYGPLVESTPGNFFGMTSAGVPSGGAIFRITSSDEFTVLNNFPQQESSPRNLIVDPAGEYYYGVAERGGLQGEGCIFRIQPSGSSYECIYEVPKDDIITTIFYTSTGHIWVSGLHNNENFMFRMRPDGSEQEPIAAYNTALAQKRKPAITMVETPEGEIFAGTNGNYSTPIFFKIRNDGTGYSKLFDLGESDRINGNLLYGSDGNFYMSYRDDGIFRFTPSGTVTRIYSYPPTGGQPTPTVNKIIEMNGGRLGIVTRVNGSGGYGSIFSIEKDGSSFTEIYKAKITDGVSPVDMLQSMDGWLYVVSEWGGTHGKGVIYKVRPDGSSFTKIREFTGADGENPNGIFFRKAAQSCTFDPLPEKKLSDPVFFPDVITSSGAPVQLSSSNPAVAIIENGFIKPVGRGMTTITAMVPANSNFYAAQPMERTLVVIKGDQIITFETLAERNISDDPFELTAVSTSGLPVTYMSSNPSVASISGPTVTIHAVGSTTITASHPGNDDFFPGSASQMLVVVNGGAQSIVFPNPGTKIFGDAPFQLGATASSGLSVTYTTMSDKIILNGSEVTILKAGIVTIQANQSGDENFDPASPVEISFCIIPLRPVITESGVMPDVEFHSSNATGNQWYLDDSIMTGHTSQSILISQEGSYTVETIIDGCISEMSSPKIFLTTGIEEEPSIKINVYPNPVAGYLNVEVAGNLSGGAVIELLDGIGRTLEVRSRTTAGTSVFDLNENHSGILLVKITVRGKTIVKKILKE